MQRRPKHVPPNAASVQDPELENEFAALLGADQAERRAGPARPQPGAEATGRVVHVGERFATVELEGGFEALWDLGDAPSPPTVGERFRGHVLRSRDRVLEVGVAVPRGGVDLKVLADAAEGGLPVEGKVVEHNRGGFVVEVGSVRGFCPLGQIDVRRIEDPAAYVDKRFMFQVMELRGDRDVVLSRRRVLEAEAAQRAAETRATIAVGARLRGEITSVRDYGAFVDVGGLQGLLPRSEMGFGRKHPSEIVRVGQTVEVEVLSWEPEGPGGRERLALSMRALTEDPFEAAARELPERAVVRGVVTRVQPYGAFVELADGVEGLLHVSAFGRRVASPRDVVREGDPALVRVLGVDQALRRIALAWVEPDRLADLLDPEVRATGNSLGVDVVGVAIDQGDGPGAGGATGPSGAPPRVGEVVQGEVVRHLRFGVLVQLPGGIEAFAPYAELEVASQQEAKRKLPEGTALELLCFEAREDRLRLSTKRLEEARERETAQAWMQRQGAGPKPAEVGSLGALLKAKLGL